jgi:hypothetical protein
MAKGIPFLYGRRSCIFCERRSPEVKISKEHLFADWLRELFPRTSETTHTMGIINWMGWVVGSRPPTTMHQGQGHSGSKKVRAVCQNCNETWMSNNVEDVAKPILIPMMTNEAITLNASMQRILSTWAAKTAMTADRVHPSKSALHQTERIWLMDELSPPSGWHVWVASYGGSDWRELGLYQNASKLTIPAVNDGAPTEHNLMLTMFAMRFLLFLVISSSWRNIWNVLDGLASPTNAGFARIWPIREDSVQWPRPLYLLDPGAEYFTTYLSRIYAQPVQGPKHKA